MRYVPEPGATTFLTHRQLCEYDAPWAAAGVEDFTILSWKCHDGYWVDVHRVGWRFPNEAVKDAVYQMCGNVERRELEAKAVLLGAEWFSVLTPTP